VCFFGSKEVDYNYSATNIVLLLFGLWAIFHFSRCAESPIYPHHQGADQHRQTGQKAGENRRGMAKGELTKLALLGGKVV